MTIETDGLSKTYGSIKALVVQAQSTVLDLLSFVRNFLIVDTDVITPVF